MEALPIRAISLALSLGVPVSLVQCSRTSPPVPVRTPPERAERDAASPETPAPVQSDAEARTSAASALQEARALRKGRRYAEAIALLEQALSRGPPPDFAASLLYARGETEFRKGQEEREREDHPAAEAAFRGAIASFDEVLRKYPAEEAAASAAYLRGSSYLMLDDPQSAKQSYALAFEGYPKAQNRVRALLRIGVCQAGLGEAMAASNTFRRLISEYSAPEHGAEISKARKYLAEISLVGRRAPPLVADSWLHGIASPAGIETFSGEVVVLVFFATWCENCAEELPHLRRVMATWADAGVVLLGVADPEDPRSPMSVSAYLERNRVPFHDVALDKGGKSWSAYRVESLPAAALIDRKGTIRWRGHPAFFPWPLTGACLAER